ncbi:heavy-metal-associated domain-containing protein [Pseudofrankia asymbiotica]|uniref:Heavy metal transporter n=1 Tax=Pseudofrankia asymbiotica TaxID=1834516 RepID=A0A1V2I3X0_9ACTN|nr:heavy-metal-associated domain-containing protein [Pseudofrankia asymbiotica]ONH24931.1 heavy metal transporter [Pseudofrankia asymbiotica]
MTTSVYQVTGMSRGHCEATVRSEVFKIVGVEDIQVSARTGRLAVTATESLAVTATESVDDARVLAAVDEAGYEAVRAR